MRPRNAVPRFETASFALSGSKPRSPVTRGWLTEYPPLFPIDRQAISCTVSSVARPHTTTPASSTSWKKVRNARKRDRSFGYAALPPRPDRDRWRARRCPSRRRARVTPKRAKRRRDVALIPERPSLAHDTPHPTLTDAHTPPSSTRGLFPAFLAASSPRDASTRSTTRACEKTKQASPTARTSSCTTAT